MLLLSSNSGLLTLNFKFWMFLVAPDKSYHGGESGGLNERVTEFRAGFRTKQVKILTISFLIPNRFSYSKVHIPSYYSRQILILELFYYVQKFFTQVLANFVFSFSTLLGLVEKTTVYYKKNFYEYLPRIMRRYLHFTA